MMLFRPILLATLFVIGSTSYAQPKSKNTDSFITDRITTFSRVAALPMWVQPLAEVPSTRRTDPVVIRLAETQMLVGDKPVVLVSRAIQVNDHSSLGTIGQYALEYNPAYQKMYLHRVTVMRGAQMLDRTATVNTRLLQRETGIEQGIYGGVTSVQLLLDDVRAGDTLWVVYSVEGANPVFGKQWASEFGWDSTVPTEMRRLTVLHPKNRPLHWRQLGDLGGAEVKPVEDEVNGLARMRFEERSIEPVDIEPSMPSDFLPAREISFSEYANWNEVAGWASKLFPEAKGSSELKALAKQFAQLPDDASKTSAALQWVQNEIRYFSVALGENSHRPQPPEIVIKRRYGDCKDKSYLLVSLLHELGIKAKPVLLLASAPKFPARVMAAPTWFDHAIVVVTLNGKTYYIDPTRTGQASTLDHLAPSFPDASGLIVDDGTQGLVTLPAKQDGVPPYEHDERVVIGKIDEDVTLESREIYLSDFAEWARRRFPLMSPNELNKEMLALYEKRYPGVTLQSPPILQDDIKTNRLEITARFTLPKALTTKDGTHGFTYETGVMAGTLGLPDKLVRKSPFALPQGRYAGRYRLHIKWPAEMRSDEAPKRTKLDNTFFHVNEEYTAWGNEVDYLLDYRLKQDTIVAKDLPALNSAAKDLTDYLQGTFRFAKKYVVSDEYVKVPFAQLEEFRAGQAMTGFEKAFESIGKPGGTDLITFCDTLVTLHAVSGVVGMNKVILSEMDKELHKQESQAGAKLCQARLLFARGDFAKSVALFESEGALKAGNANLRDLAWARLYTGDPIAAEADMVRYIAGITPGAREIADQIALTQRANRPLSEALRQFALDIPDGPWPRPILAMQIDLLTPEALIATAEAYQGDTRELAMNDAWFYVGQYHLARNESEAARKAFGWFRAHGIRTSELYTQAQAELNRLDSSGTDDTNARQAFERKDYQAARELWQRLAAAGNARAAFQVGLLYYYGYGTKIDYAEALHWYGMAAAKGMAEAQNMLGVLYSTGRGVTRDDQQAMDWYVKAAAQSEAVAQFNLARFYDEGVIVKKDSARAAELYGQSAEQGYVEAQAELAECYANGRGLKKSAVLALIWAKRAAVQGSGGGAWRAGNLIQYGEGLDHDDKEAFRYYLLAAKFGNSAGMIDVGYMYDKGLAVKKDDKEASAWYRKAAELGNSIAQYNLGQAYDFGRGVAQDFKEAMHWYRLAADQGDADAQDNLGIMFWRGSGVTRNPVAAHALFAVSARNDSSDGNWAHKNRIELGTQLNNVELLLIGQLTGEMEKPGNLLKALDRFLDEPALDGNLDYRHASAPPSHAPEAPTTDVLNNQYRMALAALWSGDPEKAYANLETIIASGEFPKLPMDEQHIVLLLTATLAMETEHKAHAYDLLKRSSAMPQQGAQDWLYRARIATDQNDMPDAMSSLRRVAVQWPETLKSIDKTVFSAMLRKFKQISENAPERFDLLNALFVARAQLPPFMDMDASWRDLSAHFTDHNQLDRAALVVKEIKAPMQLVKMQIDSRLKPLVQRVPEYFDVTRALQRSIDAGRARVQTQPRSLEAVGELIRALNLAGRHEEALATADTAIKSATVKVNGSPHYDDIANNLIWVMNSRARSLENLGRHEDAAEQLKAAAQLPENGNSAVSMPLNLGELYCRMNRPREALAAIANLGQMSGYGLMQQAAVKHCAAIELSDAVAETQAMDYLHAHQTDAPQTLQEQLTLAQKLDEAAAILAQRLADEKQRADALADVQSYKHGLTTPVDEAVYKGQQRILARDDIRQAISRVGSVGQFSLFR